MGKMIVLNGREQNVKNLKLDSLFQCEEFMSKFDRALIEYIRDHATQDERSFVMAMKKLWTFDVLTKGAFDDRFKKGDHLPVWKGTRFGWRPELTGFMRGSAFRGKKRPEHSAIMKVKMKMVSNNRSKSHRKNLSEFLKGEYYRKRALRLRVATEKECKEFSISQLKALVSSYNRKKFKSKQFRMDVVNRFKSGKKYLQEELFWMFLNDFPVVTEDNVETAYSSMMSIISIIAMKNNPNMGSTKFFKKGTIKVGCCTNRTIISYRSGWELKTILFFESSGIYYQYEPLYIPKGNGKAYLPDFILNIPGISNPVILEIKGFIRGKEGKQNEQLKISSAINFAKSNGFHYSYCKEPIASLEQVKDNILT